MHVTAAEPNPADLRLARAIQGDRSALAELARDWAPKIRRWALFELGDPVLADDAAQEALVRMCRFLDRVDPSQPFAGWLRTLTRNVARDVARNRARADVPLVDDGSEPSIASDPGRALDLERGARRAFDAFAALTPRQREVVVRCDREGLTPTEVADELGIAPGTARALLHQGRRALRERLLRHHPGLEEVVR